jgi:hypothetical protein
MTLSLIEPHLIPENAKGLIEKVSGKSKRGVEAILSELSFKKVNYKDVIRRLPVVSVKKEEKALSEERQNDKKGGLPSVGLMSEGLCSEGEGKLPAPLKAPGSSPSHPSQTETAQNFTFTGESAEETQKPENREKQEASQPVRRIKVEFVAEEGLANKIERAKEILRHKYPAGRFEDIFNQALEDMLEKRDPARKIERATKRELLETKASIEIKRDEEESEKGEENQKEPSAIDNGINDDKLSDRFMDDEPVCSPGNQKKGLGERWGDYCCKRQHRLYFFPLPQGQGAFRDTCC